MNTNDIFREMEIEFIITHSNSSSTRHIPLQFFRDENYSKYHNLEIEIQESKFK